MNRGCEVCVAEQNFNINRHRSEMSRWLWSRWKSTSTSHFYQCSRSTWTSLQNVSVSAAVSHLNVFPFAGDLQSVGSRDPRQGPLQPGDPRWTENTLLHFPFLLFGILLLTFRRLYSSPFKARSLAFVLDVWKSLPFRSDKPCIRTCCETSTWSHQLSIFLFSCNDQLVVKHWPTVFRSDDPTRPLSPPPSQS